MPASYPPLKTLRTFASVAQHLSFSKAAAELNLTQGAISKQIQQLEEYMGCSLFERSGAGVTLTEAGRQYLPQIVDALETIQLATSNVMQASAAKGRIQVSVPPSLSSLWLIPKLSQLSQDCEGIELSIKSSENTVVPNFENSDLVIRCMPLAANYEHAELLLPERLLLLADPGQLPGNVTGIEQLLSLRAFSHITRPQVWNQFWSAHNIARHSPEYGPGFEHFYMVLEAIKQQAGLALIPDFMAHSSLETGSAVNPLSLSFDSGYGYYLFCPSYRRCARRLQMVIDWFRDNLSPWRLPD